MSVFGDRVVRVEDPKLLTVGGTYVADLRIPELDGACHVTYVRSTMAHARIASVETEDARRAPGVLGVFTAADLDLAPLPASSPMFNAAMTRPFLAIDAVRFVGEPIAVVLTERPEQGADAAELVWADYDPLPAVVEPVDAATDAVVVHEAAGTNTVVNLSFGRTEDLFDACEVVSPRRSSTSAWRPCPLNLVRRRRHGSADASCNGRAPSTRTGLVMRSHVCTASTPVRCA